jgi:hypothetical protein
MGLWDSPTQIFAIFRSPGKIKRLIHYHTILALPALSPPFQPHSYLPQHHEVDFGLTHKA